MKAQLFPILALAFTIGCAAPKYTIQIDSEPKGARVEVNNEDLGQTPTTFTVEGTGNGEFIGSWGPAPYIVFSCTPPVGLPALYPQKKTFRPNGFFQAATKFPNAFSCGVDYGNAARLAMRLRCDRLKTFQISSKFLPHRSRRDAFGHGVAE